MRTSLALLAFATLGATATAAQAPDLTPYFMADRGAEVALARSAAPREVSGDATIYVLTRTGYVAAATGRNGFACLVARSFHAGPDDPNFWNPRIRAPHCFNPPAVRSVLPEMLTRAEWILGGASKEEVAQRTRRGFATRTLSLPATGAMAYMLSHEQVLGDADPHWLPHVMFYFAAGATTGAWAAADMQAPVITDPSTRPGVPVRVVLVPARLWSDGTPAPAPAQQGH